MTTLRTARELQTRLNDLFDLHNDLVSRIVVINLNADRIRIYDDHQDWVGTVDQLIETLDTCNGDWEAFWSTLPD